MGRGSFPSRLGGSPQWQGPPVPFRAARMPSPLQLLKEELLGKVLAIFERACGGQGHLLSISGDYPPVLLRALVVPPIDRIDRVRIDRLESHCVITRVLQVVLFSVETSGVAVVP